MYANGKFFTALLRAGVINGSAQTVTQPKPAQPATIKANHEAAQQLPASGGVEEQEAKRGFIAALPDAVIQSSRAGSFANALGEYGSLAQVIGVQCFGLRVAE